jgi:hypothetical protein
MTIREYVKRRFRNLALIFALPYAALQVLRVCIRHCPEAFTAKPWLLVLSFTEPRFLWIVLAWFVYKMLTIPCPRCSNPLGAAVAAIWDSTKINRCGRCRVSLDEPVKPTDPRERS